MNKLDKIWLSCAIDGEGTLYRHNIKRQPNGKQVIIEVSNSNLEFINRANKLINGKIKNNGKRKAHWNTVYVTRLTRKKEVYKILKELLPYFIIKRKKAIEFIKLLES